MITDQIAAEPEAPPPSPQMQPGLDEVRARVTDLHRHARSLIRQRPIVAVLTALAVGYLTARFVSRATR